MDFLAIESYEEDLGVFTAFGGYDSNIKHKKKFETK